MTMRYLLINPNTNKATTAMMLDIARATLDGRATIDGMTAERGAVVITTEAALAQAGKEVLRMTGGLGAKQFSGVVIAAFGDPALAETRAALRVPVVGIAEAAIREAASGGRRFSIVTTTPALDAALRRRVEACGAGSNFAGIRYTRSGPAGMMAAPTALRDELYEACRRSMREDDVDAIIIGGGPLAAAARALRPHVSATLIEPVPAAMRALLAQATSPS
jgi:allantoin racemase